MEVVDSPINKEGNKLKPWGFNLSIEKRFENNAICRKKETTEKNVTYLYFSLTTNSLK